jgi:hypothetical protein
MIIKILFPYYKECPIYYKILEQAKMYKGQHILILRIAQGTIVHDVRNVLVAETNRIYTDWKLPEFDVAVFIDSDCDGNLEDIIYLAESDKDVIGLPYTLKGQDDKYNAGFILKDKYEHLPKTTKGLIEVHGQGNGFKAIKRKVFETIKPSGFWFWPDILEFEDGSFESMVEDWSFDSKVRKAGFRVWCNFDKPVKHELKKEEKMQLAKSQRASQTMLNNISTYIGQLVETIEALQEENEKLKFQIESKTNISSIKSDT